MTETDQTAKHFFPVTIEKAASDEYDARFVMSAATADRVHDTIDPDAYKDALGRRVVALWQHDSSKPFGYWHDLEVKGGKLIGKLKAASTNLGRMVKQLIADGVPLGASIGFRGEGKANDKGGVHFSKLELLECSVVSVPMHPAAVQIAKSYGFQPSKVLEPDNAAESRGQQADDSVETHEGRVVLEKAMRVLTRG